MDRENNEFETIEAFIEQIMSLTPVEQGMLLGFMQGIRVGLGGEESGDV